MGKEGRKDVVVSRLVKDDQPSSLLDITWMWDFQC